MQSKLVSADGCSSLSPQEKSNFDRIPVKKYSMLTTLELISSILTILLAITEPHAGDAVPTGAGKVTLFTPGPMGYWNIPTQRRKFQIVMRVSHENWFVLPNGMFSGCSGHYLSLGRVAKM